MALPSKTKTWGYSANNRITYSSLVQVTRDWALGFKNYLKTLSGVTVKGSSNGSAAAMDASDRWSVAGDITRGSNATSAQSWIVLDFANMGGTEVLLAFRGTSDDHFYISFSPGGNFVAAGTPTHTPTATDECNLQSGSFVSSSTSADRLWTCAGASDGSAIFFLMFRSNALVHSGLLQLCTSAVLSPATFSPATWGFVGGTTLSISTLSSTGQTNGARCFNGSTSGNVTVKVGGEGFASQLAVERFSGTQTVLQGGSAYLIQPTAVWTETASFGGKLGNAIDFWAGNVSQNDGDTYPNDATNQFIGIGDWVFPWNGSAVVRS